MSRDLPGVEDGVRAVRVHRKEGAASLAHALERVRSGRQGRRVQQLPCFGTHAGCDGLVTCRYSTKSVCELQSLYPGCCSSCIITAYSAAVLVSVIFSLASATPGSTSAPPGRPTGFRALVCQLAKLAWEKAGQHRTRTVPKSIVLDFRMEAAFI